MYVPALLSMFQCRQGVWFDLWVESNPSRPSSGIEVTDLAYCSVFFLAKAAPWQHGHSASRASRLMPVRLSASIVGTQCYADSVWHDMCGESLGGGGRLRPPEFSPVTNTCVLSCCKLTVNHRLYATIHRDIYPTQSMFHMQK